MNFIKHIKITGVLALLLCSTAPAFACDVCGSSAGGNYFGILPQFQKNYVGLRYQYRAFDSEHLTLFPGEIPLRTAEAFHSTELWGRYVPHKKVHVFAFIPYNYYTKDEAQLRSVVSGIGDVSLITNYILINTGEQAGKVWKHALQAGIGIKFPTGKSNHIPEYAGLLVPNLQTGSGSFDLPLNLVYTLRYKKLGINMEGNYRVNTVNKRGYQFGDRIASSFRLFYWQNIRNISLLPHIGSSFEYSGTDKNKGTEQEYTGSKVVTGNAGMDLYYKQLILNFSAQIPLYQHIAKGQISARSRFHAGISFLLAAKQKKQTTNE